MVAAGSLYLGAVTWTYLRSAYRGFIGNGDVERRLWFAQAIALTASQPEPAGAG